MDEFISTVLNITFGMLFIVPSIILMIGKCSRHDGIICCVCMIISFIYFAVNIIIYHLFYIDDDDKYI